MQWIPATQAGEIKEGHVAWRLASNHEVGGVKYGKKGFESGWMYYNDFSAIEVLVESPSGSVSEVDLKALAERMRPKGVDRGVRWKEGFIAGSNYSQSNVEGLKKLLRIAGCPEVLIENPSSLSSPPSKEDIAWAEKSIEAYESNASKVEQEEDQPDLMGIILRQLNKALPHNSEASIGEAANAVYDKIKSQFAK